MTARALFVLISAVVLIGVLFGAVILAGPETREDHDDPWKELPKRAGPVDHSAYFTESFADGPAVTRACLTCHPEASKQVMATTHWTWSGDAVTHPDSGETVYAGKKNVLNNFCIAISANWPRCTSCHVGYGWRDGTYLKTEGLAEDRVDCLVCHDGTGRYEKEPAGAGHPVEGVDLLAVARSVGRAGREHCGGCHFKGGGGDGVKHGDLDETMYFPAERVDVHMGRHGLVCSDCHRTKDHVIKGRLLPSTVYPETRVACTDCHAEAPHIEDRLNTHGTAVACQTCHIPYFAVETGTKMWWDWSKAGRKGHPEQVAHDLVEEIAADPDLGKKVPARIAALFLRVGKDPDVHAHYIDMKGLFLVARRVEPEYRWYNLSTERHLPGQKVDPDRIVTMNRPMGEAHEPDARIWPFKVHRGRQPVDLEHRHLLVPHVFGEGGYWKTFDWETALQGGAKASGIPYSGKWGWAETAMYWPQNHMVQRKEDALRCLDCHGPGGRMKWAELGYPGDPAHQGDRRQMGLVRDEKGEER